MEGRYDYISLHVGSGKRFHQSGQFSSEADFLRHLNEWNRNGCGDYVYYSVLPVAPHIPVSGQTTITRMGNHIVKVPSGVVIDELDELLGDEPSQGC